MKTIQNLLVISAILLVPALCQAFDVSGSYTSSEGAIRLQQSGDRVSGSYTSDNGALIGLMFDQTLEGFWIEDKSDRRCDTPKHGRYYWGRVTFNFTKNGFKGSWSYCNEVPSRPWSGERR